jgi:hypothetical protein
VLLDIASFTLWERNEQHFVERQRSAFVAEASHLVGRLQERLAALLEHHGVQLTRPHHQECSGERSHARVGMSRCESAFSAGQLFPDDPDELAQTRLAPFSVHEEQVRLLCETLPVRRHHPERPARARPLSRGLVAVRVRAGAGAEG